MPKAQRMNINIREPGNFLLATLSVLILAFVASIGWQIGEKLWSLW